MGTLRRTTTDPTDTRLAHETVVDDRVREGRVQQDWVTERRWAMDASDVLALLAGLFFAVVGIIALVNLGFDDFPSEATTEVMGMVHTHIWAIVSIVLGLFFLAGVGGRGRSMTTFAGALAVVVGIVVVAAYEQLDPVIATNTTYGWVTLVAGAVVLLAAIAVPTVESHRRDRVVDRHDRAVHI